MIKVIFKVNYKPCIGNRKGITNKHLNRVAKEMFGNNYLQLFSKRREHRITVMKKTFIREVYDSSKITFEQIAKYLGLHHSTVMHHYKYD